MLARSFAAQGALTNAAISRIEAALEGAGTRVESDVRLLQSGDRRDEADSLARALEVRWSEQPPDVVHAFGWVACVAALSASRGRVPVVVTVDEPSGSLPAEEDVFRSADGLVVRSSTERDGWLALGVPAERIHVVPLAVEVGGQVPGERTGAPLVVTDARGRMLERILASMRSWPQHVRLGVAQPVSREQLEVVDAAEPRVRCRVDVVELDEPLWARATLVLAGPSGARHAGLVLEGAAHGVPAVASEIGAHCDVVVDGATGVLLPVTARAEAIGQAVTGLLLDPLRLRGFGLAARLRVRAAHDPKLVAERCVVAYEQAVSARLYRMVDPDNDAETGGGAGPVELSAPRGGGPGADGWNHLVLEHLPMARRLAQRYAGRGQSVDDLVQVANLGLVKAAQRFESDQGTPFVAYAVPTMLGELRRYFRDNAWAIHVPRSVQETALRVRHAGDRLRQSLGHEVDVNEIARDLGLPVDDVREAHNASGVAFSCRSLDAALLDDGDSRLSEMLGFDDASLEQIEAREALRQAFGRLPEREREILVLRFFGELTQSEIAQQLGISQMHVSRLLARTLRALRQHVVEDAPLPSRW